MQGYTHFVSIGRLTELKTRYDMHQQQIGGTKTWHHYLSTWQDLLYIQHTCFTLDEGYMKLIYTTKCSHWLARNWHAWDRAVCVTQISALGQWTPRQSIACNPYFNKHKNLSILFLDSHISFPLLSRENVRSIMLSSEYIHHMNIHLIHTGSSDLQILSIKEEKSYIEQRKRNKNG